jgi:hypothetical protein
MSTPPDQRVVKVLVPTGMLGGGFPEQSIDRGIERGADVIAVDGGSTDSGPYYLGTGRPKTTDEGRRRRRPGRAGDGYGRHRRNAVDAWLSSGVKLARREDG